MSRTRFVVLAAALTTACAPSRPARLATASPPPIAHAPDALAIVTWNIWMMPSWTFQSPKNEARAHAIAAELHRTDADIFCLEKAFDPEARAVVAADLAYPHRYGPLNGDHDDKLNGGVWVLSRIPLSLRREIEFEDSLSAERAARKGAMLLGGIHRGHPFQLIATHLQGDDGGTYDPVHQRVRDRQIAQMARSLVPLAPRDQPLIFCGDFSTSRFVSNASREESEDYRSLVRTLGVENGEDARYTLRDDCASNDLADDRQGRHAEMDYVLLRQPIGARLTGVWQQLSLEHPGWDAAGHRNLAYRDAVMAAFTFP